MSSEELAADRRKMGPQFWVTLLLGAGLNLAVLVLGGGYWIGVTKQEISTLDVKIDSLVTSSKDNQRSLEEKLLEKTADRYTSADARRDQELWNLQRTQQEQRIASIENEMRKMTGSVQEIRAAVTGMDYRMATIGQDIAEMKQMYEGLREWFVSLRDRQIEKNRVITEHLEKHNGDRGVMR